jgi:hypothetical protein
LRDCLSVRPSALAAELTSFIFIRGDSIIMHTPQAHTLLQIYLGDDDVRQHTHREWTGVKAAHE